MFDVFTVSAIHGRRKDGETCQHTAVPMESSSNATSDEELRLMWQGWGRNGMDEVTGMENEKTIYRNMVYATSGESMELNDFTCQNVQAVVRLHCGKKLLTYRLLPSLKSSHRI